LAGIPAILEMPTDRPRPAQQSDRAGRETFVLPAQLGVRLKELTRAENTDLYVVFLAALQTLLHRYAGQTDICVGAPARHRVGSCAGETAGAFSNIVVLRGDLSGQLSFRELVRRLRPVVAEAYAHQEAPFHKLAEILQPERSGHAPLVQVMLTLDNGSGSAADRAGTAGALLEQPGVGARVDLSLWLLQGEDELSGCLDYSADLFDATTARRMLGHFETLLQGVVEAPGQSISSFGLLTGAERSQMLVEWNDTAAAVPEKCVHEVIEEHARRAPGSIAMVFEQRSITYEELNCRADLLAHHLGGLGLRPGTLAGIYADRSVEVVIAMLAVLKAGGAFATLDPAYPKERLAFMAGDAGLAVLLTQTRLQEDLPAPVAHVVNLDTFDWSQPPRTERLPAVSPNELAYVIYTSGSTGKPKGVAIEHRAFMNTLESFRRAVGYQREDHLLATAALSFDMGVLDVFLPLSCGSQLTMMDREFASDGHRLARVIANRDITYMQATPATFRLLLESGWQGKGDLRVLSGGEKMTRDLANRLLERTGGVFNGYGPTEISICCTATKVENTEGLVPIGYPLANTLHYVLDAQMQPVPIGVPGELYIGGAGLAREYLNRPELTAERFIPNPFGPGRIYKSGDVVRWRPDGQLQYVGRTDDQVKLRGFRIELGEIEAAMLLHPAVNGACAMVREDSPGDAQLVAYYIGQSSDENLGQELKQWLRQRLPEHTVPSRFVALETFPLTPNGKVDRQALPAAPAQTASAGQPVPLETPTQQLLADVWEKALGVKGIGPQDNFYDLGGHSLLAMQVVREMEQRTGVRTHPGKMVFQSLGQIAALYERNAKPVETFPPKTWMTRLSSALGKVLGGA
jgi:amino acid adenylation domain-containing protein